MEIFFKKIYCSLRFQENVKMILAINVNIFLFFEYMINKWKINKWMTINLRCTCSQYSSLFSSNIFYNFWSCWTRLHVYFIATYASGALRSHLALWLVQCSLRELTTRLAIIYTKLWMKEYVDIYYKSTYNIYIKY